MSFNLQPGQVPLPVQLPVDIQAVNNNRTPPPPPPAARLGPADVRVEDRVEAPVQAPERKESNKHSKYLKYKMKYLELKKSLNII